MYGPATGHYIFNFRGEAARAAELLRARMWDVGPAEPHRDSLVPGDLALIYLAAPERTFVGRAELDSRVHDWTASEAQRHPGDLPGGVLLVDVEEWDPPVPMGRVLSRIDRSAGARGDFEAGVVRVTADEYRTALAVAAEARGRRR